MKYNDNCEFCGYEFDSNTKKKFCGKVCQGKSHSKNMAGDKNSNYKGAENYSFVCETCGSPFTSYGEVHRFCSMSCNAKRPDNIERLKKLAPIAAALPRKPRKKLGRRNKCKACGVEFRSEGKKTYCPEHKSTFHGGKERKGAARLCVICGNSFNLPTKNDRKTCSEKCKSDALTARQEGDKSHFWEGGKTSAAMKIRSSKEYKSWRKAVFKRDDYTCQWCKQKGGNLNADHIKAFSSHPDLRLDINNGRTLCYECHLKTDTFGGRGRLCIQENGVN